MGRYFTTIVFAILFVATLAVADDTTATGQTTGVSNTSGNTNTPSDTNLNPSKNSRLMEGPSQEAISACGGKNLGSACSYTGPDAMSASGTCTKPNKTALLACRESTSTRKVR